MSSSSFLFLRKSKYKYCFCALRKYTDVFAREKHYDIAIVGGGLIGSAMACSVVKNPKLSDQNVVMFESRPETSTPKLSVKDDYRNRVYSINLGSRKFLEFIDVWKYICEVRYKTVKKIQVWDACSDAIITFNDDLVRDISYIVENDLLLYGLEQICNEHRDKIDVKYESKVKNVELPKKNEPVQLEMQDGNKYTCSLLIGADGANSQIRKTIGCQYLYWNYNQKGIVATMKLAEPSENVVAWQRFLPTGPIALLPLNEELSSLVWSTETKEAEALMELSDEEFVDAVNNAFWKTYPQNELVRTVTNTLNNVLESISMSSNAVQQLPPSVSSVFPKSRRAFPLAFGHSTKYVAPGVALIGDAAHRVHPLAGQGANLGFGDVECLTNKLAESVFNGEKIGCSTALQKYESERQKQLLLMLGAIDLLQKLYTTSFPPVVMLRTLGLQITNVLEPVKKLIIDKASYTLK